LSLSDAHRYVVTPQTISLGVFSLYDLESMQCIDRYEGLTRDLIKRRPAVGFALTVPSAPFCTSTTAGGTGRVQPRLLCKKRDHPVTASSDTAAKPATSR